MSQRNTHRSQIAPTLAGLGASILLLSAPPTLATSSGASQHEPEQEQTTEAKPGGFLARISGRINDFRPSWLGRSALILAGLKSWGTIAYVGTVGGGVIIAGKDSDDRTRPAPF